MNKKQKVLACQIIISTIAFIVTFIIDKIFNLNSVFEGPVSFLFPLFLYLSIYIYIARNIVRKSVLGILHGKFFDENFLMFVATLGAFGLGIYNGIVSNNTEGFSEAVGVILFYQVGELFQSIALSKSRKEIDGLMNIRPNVANLMVGTKPVVTKVEDIKVGKVILVKPGDRIPLDGVIIQGESSIDTKTLTGEAMPKYVKENDEVLSGTINLTGSIQVYVTKTSNESTISKIIDQINNSKTKKAKSEQFISKFSKYYTPVVVVFALMLFIIPSLITKDISTWLYRALCFLVVSCPCALVVSVPLSFFSGIGLLSSKGILVKGANYIEAYSKANYFVFDKTGTLTKGEFKVTKVYPDKNRNEILRLAATAERNSNHPIAKAIIKEYGKQIRNIGELKNIAGKGIVCKTNEGLIIVGNDKLMKEKKVDFEKVKQTGNIIYVSLDDNYRGYIIVEDEIKKEAKEVINYLNNQGYTTMMLTGDDNDIASKVANELKVKKFGARLLPLNKVDIIKDIKEEKDKNDVICFVGDGINDSPSLAISDIGIAMGGIGEDVAIEASDIVLLKDDLRALIDLKEISKDTIKTIKVNITFALSIKFIILVLSAIGITNMWLAIFGDVGVAVLAILYAIRKIVFKKRK